ncbi:hypothetical protein VXM67_00900 [Pseudomonas sp. Rh2]|uniref:hypothetical protein n=1 Tax=Pseudomonas sp. Rh2 TaxID=3112956 RepID=UPI00345D554B
MKLAKSLLIFGVFGPIVLAPTNSFPIDPSYKLIETLLIVLATWIIFNLTIMAYSIFAASLPDEKVASPIELLPIFNILTASFSLYITLKITNLFCLLLAADELLQLTCSVQLLPSTAQLLTFGLFCGGLQTSFTHKHSINIVKFADIPKAINEFRYLATQAKKLWWTLPLLTTLAIFLLFYNGLFPLKGDSLETRGQFGDSFGVLNSLFSGLGFGGLIITLLYQQKQISHQEKESTIRRQFDETQHYEGIFYKLLSIYSKTLDEVSSNNGELVGRQVLRGSIDRAYSSLKSQNVNSIPQALQRKHEKNKLSKEESLLIDYVYFRNFKILSVEIEKQKRLVETFKILLRHTVQSLPMHLDGKPYFDIIKSQLNHTEASYFFLVSLTFEDEKELRKLICESELFEKIANTKITRVHEMMYKEFWGIDIRQHKIKQRLPMGRARIDQAVRAFKHSSEEKHLTNLLKYTPARVTMSTAIVSNTIMSGHASNHETFDNT